MQLPKVEHYIVFPAAEHVGVFEDWTETFINWPQTTIYFLPKWPAEWTNFAAAVQIRCNCIDHCCLSGVTATKKGQYIIEKEQKIINSQN